MKSLVITLLIFVLFDNSIKLCSSHPNILTTLEQDIGKTIQVIPRVVNDAAPYVSQMPIVGPAAGLGRVVGADLAGALGPNKGGAVPGVPGYPPGAYPNRPFQGNGGGQIRYPVTGRMGRYENFVGTRRFYGNVQNRRFVQNPRQYRNFQYPQRPIYPGHLQYPIRRG